MGNAQRTLADRYRLDEVIGAGGMGEVWRATDLVLDRPVAVKLMLSTLIAEPDFERRFLLEARAMAAIRHPGVVAVHDYGSGPDGAYLVMELIDGESLASLLRRVRRLDPIDAMNLVAQAADALQSAHEQGLKDFEASTWFAFFLPSRTPGPIVQRLHEGTVAAMETPALQARLLESGAIVVAPDRRSPDYLRRFVDSEIEKNAKPLKAAGIAMD